MENISHRFILWVILLFIVVVSIIGAFYFDNSRMILKNQYIESFDKSVVQLDNSISEFFHTFESALEMFSKNEMVQNVSDDPKQYYLPTMQLFKSFQQSYSSTAFAYFAPEKIILENKKLVTWPDTTKELARTDWVASKRPWYVGAVKANGKNAWTKPYVDATTKKPIITISKVVKNDKGQFKGVIAIDFFLDELSNRVENFKAFKQGYAYLIDRDQGNYVFISKDIRDNQFDKILQSNWINKVFERKKGSFYIKDHNGGYYVTYTTNDITGWKVLGIVEEEKIYENTGNMLKEIFSSSLMIIIIGFICIIYISKQMSKSIKDLSNSLNNNLIDMDVSMEKGNELSKQFNSLLGDNGTYEDLIDEGSCYINLLFESEREMEKIINIMDANYYQLEILNELENSVDKLIGIWNEFDSSNSNLHQIQKENIENHLYLAVSKIKERMGKDSEFDEAFMKIERKINFRNY